MGLERLAGEPHEPLGGGRQPVFRGRPARDETDLVDEVSTLTWQTNGVVYGNFYRLGDTGRFTAEESARLSEVLPLLAQMIALHHRSTPILGAADGRADGPEEEIRRLDALLGPPLDRLTSRERDVCLRVLLGDSSEAIALHLEIATSSVVTYRKRAYETSARRASSSRSSSAR